MGRGPLYRSVASIVASHNSMILERALNEIGVGGPR
jgi:hypothetical protein